MGGFKRKCFGFLWKSCSDNNRSERLKPEGGSEGTEITAVAKRRRVPQPRYPEIKAVVGVYWQSDGQLSWTQTPPSCESSEKGAPTPQTLCYSPVSASGPNHPRARAKRHLSPERLKWKAPFSNSWRPSRHR